MRRHSPDDFSVRGRRRRIERAVKGLSASSPADFHRVRLMRLGAVDGE
jgi:hypothetical protein